MGNVVGIEKSGKIEPAAMGAPKVLPVSPLSSVSMCAAVATSQIILNSCQFFNICVPGFPVPQMVEEALSPGS